MRAFRNTFSSLVALAAVVALAIFLLENSGPLRVHFVGDGFSANLRWIVAGSALLGAIFSFVLLAPGRVAAGWRNHALGRAGVRREQDVHTHQEQYQRLMAEHAVLQAQHGQVQSEYQLVQRERDDLRSRLAASLATQSSSPAPEAEAIAPAAEPSLR